MIYWWMNPQYSSSSAAALFGDIDRVFSLDGERIATIR
jgi:hypothetical protein